MFSVDYKQIQQAWIPWAQKCCLGESHIKKAMQAFIDFLTPPEMREGYSNAELADFEKGMDKQADKAFQEVCVLLEDVCAMGEDMPAERKEGTSMPADRKDTEQKAAGMS
jgi:hypothetical protein